MAHTEKIVKTLVDLTGNYDDFQIRFLRQDIEKLVSISNASLHNDFETLIDYLEKLVDITIFSCDKVL